MKPEPDRGERRNLRGVAVGIALLIVIAGFALYYPWISSYEFREGGIIFQTVATQTMTNFTTLTQTLTEVQTVSMNFTSYVTVTQPLPPSVVVEGTAKTTGQGTTATEVVFAPKAGEAIIASINGGVFSASVANEQIYAVKIRYNQAIGAGECSVGTMLIDTTKDRITLDLSC